MAVACPQDWPSKQMAIEELSLEFTSSSYFFPLKNRTIARVTTNTGINFFIIF
jgi:hypothetical protein